CPFHILWVGGNFLIRFLSKIWSFLHRKSIVVLLLSNLRLRCLMKGFEGGNIHWWLNFLGGLPILVLCRSWSICFGVNRGFINIELSDGSFISIGVEVPWLSMCCLKCRSFSHSGKHYSKKNEVKV
ncbi:hypothetical protein Goarm_020210, partial [Gossypium armourianum]|nr:hypothetical protein [Gossypium armourianum]